jgi:hypothetical protein
MRTNTTQSRQAAKTLTLVRKQQRRVKYATTTLPTLPTK